MIDTATKRIAPFWIQTFTGRAFDLHEPKAEQVSIEDIAHSLALVTRYTGHCAWHYSVAQHSVLVAEIVAATEPRLALAALLHDSAEAYCGDWSSPLKAVIRAMAPDVLKIEQRIELAIGQRFGVPIWPTDPLVKGADLVALSTEKRDLFGPPPQDGWGDATGYTLPAPLDRRIEMLTSGQAERAFLRAFAEYMA